MLTFENLSYFAQTWGLVFLVIMFAAALFYTFRPGARRTFEEAARMPLKED
jgi:cytochrome c oxidase cbb3-type subunit IV